MALRDIVTRRKSQIGRLVVTGRGLTTHTLPDLAYDYGALEPAISGEIMQIHHQKHHKAYVTNFNNSLELLDSALPKGDAPTVVKLQSALKFNGGDTCFELQSPYDI